MSALWGGIPRALKSHKTREAWVYRRYCVATLARLGPLSPAALPTLREAGLAVLDLARLRAELEELRARRGGGIRRGQERRARSEIRKTRVQLMLLERRLEELATQHGRATTVDQLLRDAWTPEPVKYADGD